MLTKLSTLRCSQTQTGQGVMLPIFPPYDKIEFLAMGELHRTFC